MTMGQQTTYYTLCVDYIYTIYMYTTDYIYTMCSLLNDTGLQSRLHVACSVALDYATFYTPYKPG